MRRFLGTVAKIGIAAVVIVGAVVLFHGQANNVVPARETQILEETQISLGDLSVSITGTGALTPTRQVALVFEASGRVAEVFREVGDRVSAGDVIAHLDVTELQSLFDEAQIALDLQMIAYEAAAAPPRDVDIAAAEAALGVAQASASAAYNPTAAQQVEVARLQAELARNRLWQAQLQRDLSISQPGGFSIDISGLLPEGEEIPQEIIDQANAALAGLFPSQPPVNPDSFNSGLNQAEYGVAIADANLAAQAGEGSADVASLAQANAAIISAQVALDRLLNGATDMELQAAQISVEQARLAVEQAQLSLERATLVAPFDGVIAQHNLVVGELPPTQEPAVLLIDDSIYVVDLAIDETDIVEIELGQPVQFRFDALPDSVITGRVTRIAVAPTVIGQLVAYPVQVTLDPTDELMRIGMTATATIIVDELQDTLILANRFVRIDRTTQQAYITVESAAGVYEEAPVTLGLRNETESQIVSGAAAGQRVVLLPRAAFDPITGR
jgi:HlyD family secretion protein